MADEHLGAHLPPDLAAKLVKILGMLGSDYDGEVAAAGRRANAIVKDAGLMWDEVISSSAPIPQQPHRPPRRWRKPGTPSDTAALCMQWRDEVLTDWEADFCRSIVGRHRISTKQAGVLARIVNKVEAFARAAGEWA
jgi:hypothetical protein